MTLNTRENVRRSKSLSRFKNAICMDDGYRQIFKHDRFYVYHLTPHFFFATNQCNSFALLPDQSSFYRAWQPYTCAMASSSMKMIPPFSTEKSGFNSKKLMLKHSWQESIRFTQSIIQTSSGKILQGSRLIPQLIFIMSRCSK